MSTVNAILQRSNRFAKRFWRDESGISAAWVGVASVPMVIGLMAAYETTMTLAARERLKSVMQGAAVLATNSGETDEAVLTNIAKDYVALNLQGTRYETVPTISAKRLQDPNTGEYSQFVTVEATAQIPSFFFRIMPGTETLMVNSFQDQADKKKSVDSAGRNTNVVTGVMLEEIIIPLEVALVFDESGSMGNGEEGTRLYEAKKAAKELLKILWTGYQETPSDPDLLADFTEELHEDVEVAIVPFSGNVNIHASDTPKAIHPMEDGFDAEQDISHVLGGEPRAVYQYSDWLDSEGKAKWHGNSFDVKYKSTFLEEDGTSHSQYFDAAPGVDAIRNWIDDHVDVDSYSDQDILDKTGIEEVPRNHLQMYNAIGLPWGGCVEARPGSSTSNYEWDYLKDENGNRIYYEEIPSTDVWIPKPDSSVDAADDWDINDWIPNPPSVDLQDLSDPDDDVFDPGDPNSLWVPFLARHAGNNRYMKNISNGNDTNGKDPNYYLSLFDREKADGFNPEDGTTGLTLADVTPPETNVNASSGRTPARGCPTHSLPLSRKRTVIEAHIDKLKPKQQAHTNMLTGLAWGWRFISHNPPFVGSYRPKEEGEEKLVKAIILLTDGDNSIPDGYPFAYGWLDENRMLTDDGRSWTDDRPTANEHTDHRMLKLCKNIADENIRIYTVGFNVSNRNFALLKTCATAGAWRVKSGEELVKAFKEIAASLKTVVARN